MASVINGTNILLYRYDPETSESYLFGASTSCTFNSTTDQVEVTTLDSDGYKEYKNGQNAWTVTCDGFIKLDTNYNYLMLLENQMDKTPMVIQFSIDNDNGGDADLGFSVFTGTANITSISFTGSVEGTSTYSISLQGSGLYTITGTSPTPSGIVISGSTVQMFDYTATGAEGYSVTWTGAIGLTCVSVSRGGIEVRSIGTTGVPTGEDVTFNSATGVLTFARALEADEYIRAIFK